MIRNVTSLIEHVRGELDKVIVGQRQLTDQLILTILCRGHALVEGVPGVAKTLAVKTLARLFRLQFQRVQCSPDLMPADIIGTNVFNTATGEFLLHRGPLFTDLLLVDEVNRTPPRTQSALLEAMEERQATIDGRAHPLPAWFTVFATQNPIEFEGTYPLPEAQLDRFLMKIRVGYPGEQEEQLILQRSHEGFDAAALDRMDLSPAPPDLLAAARQELASVRVEEALLGYIAALIRRTRSWPTVSLGASPRAGVALMYVARGMAALEGRDFMIPDDVKSAALPVLRHRLLLKPEATLENLGTDQVITEVIAGVEVPK